MSPSTDISGVLNAALASGSETQFNLEIIDVFEDPAQAELDRIMATPTLLRVAPPPQKRLMGDLADHELVRMLLEL